MTRSGARYNMMVIMARAPLAARATRSAKSTGRTAVSQNPQFLFDFGSPNAFLSHEAIPAIEKRTGAKFEYVPVLLGGIFKATNNKSPAETLAGIRSTRITRARSRR